MFFVCSFGNVGESNQPTLFPLDCISYTLLTYLTDNSEFSFILDQCEEKIQVSCGWISEAADGLDAVMDILGDLGVRASSSGESYLAKPNKIYSGSEVRVKIVTGTGDLWDYPLWEDEFGGESCPINVGVRPLIYEFLDTRGILDNGKNGKSETSAYDLVMK